MRGAFLTSVAAAAWAFAGCAANASVSIDLHTDLAPAEEFDEIVVSIDGVEVDSSGVGAAEYVVAGRRLGPFAVAAGLHAVQVSLESRGTRVLSRGQRLSVVGSVVLPVWIMRTCASVACPSASAPTATECQDGRCVEPSCTAGDPCASACTSAADCEPAAASCAQVRCIESHCVAIALSGECAPDEYCDPDLGCLPRTVPVLDAGRVDAGPSDASATDTGPFGIDAPPTGGCTTDADCPGPSYGGWSGCGGFSNACDESGTRDRDVTTYSCSSGACVPAAGTESSGCARATEGDTCGTESTSVVASCSYSDLCDTSGTETMRTTRYTCMAGSCRSWGSDWTRACSRSTTGTLCDRIGSCPWTCMAGACEPVCGTGCPC